MNNIFTDANAGCMGERIMDVPIWTHKLLLHQKLSYGRSVGHFGSP